MLSNFENLGETQSILPTKIVVIKIHYFVGKESVISCGSEYRT